MAVGDTTSRTPSLRRTDAVSETDSVRHFDELSHREQRRFLALVRTGTTPGSGEGLFEDGEVVVFTDYFRIVRR